MARSLWKGYITFGLVNVPIELHTAVRDRRPRFRLLHRKDLSPISMERVCQKDGQAVAWDDLVKGYEVEPGSFIAVTEDDFKTAAVERSRSIDIRDFVPVKDIDARYWDTPYVTVPSNGGESTYALLVAALEKSGRAGIAKYVMRERQHLAAVRGMNGQLMLSTLRFHDDLVAEEKGRASSASSKELGLAIQLIEGLKSDWDPTRYSDDYVRSLMKVIDAKAHGVRRAKGLAPARRPTNVVDLAERLRQSLAAVKSGREERPASRARPVRATREPAGQPTAPTRRIRKRKAA
ncbi:MAG: Ku protein [Acidobacteria bacterium]|nr:Ku protein [Acidobacteriota bacterium]